MRVLAIRGANLASLEGTFELDLEHGSLGRSGLFVITGPTGAGKSTLLDALSLALFDRTPRTSSAGVGVVIGGGDDASGGAGGVRSTDPRSVLRRGAGSGFAEVDFEGRDGRRYRARWSVRRARERPDGRLQNQEVKLEDLETGAALGSTRKTETLAEIERRLGLTYDQFRRSVLLAQGDFASFLRAPPGERAELLERMTGTELYGAISRAAHERARAASARLAELEERRGGVDALEADERTALDERWRERGAARATVQARLEALARMRDWYRTSSELERDLAATETRLKQVRDRQRFAKRDRRELAEVDQAAPLAAALAELADAEARLAGSVAHETGTEQALAAAEAARTSAARDLEGARAALEEVRRRALELRPRIEDARRLDAELERARAHGQALAERLGTAREGIASAEAEQVRVGAEAAALAERGADLDRRLDGERALAHVAARWEILEREATEAASAADEARALAVEEARAGEALAAATEARAAAALAVTQAEAAGRAAAEALVAAETAEGALDLAGLVRATVSLDEALLRERELGTCAERARERAAVIGELVRALEEGRRTLERAAAAVVAGVQVCDDTKDSVAEARRALEAGQRTIALEDLRRTLEAGAPCPLCGALEHPLRDGHGGPEVSELEARVDAEERRLEDARLALERARDDHRRLIAEQADRERRRADLELSEAADRERRAALEMVRAGDPLLTELARSAPPGGVLAALEKRRAELAERLAGAEHAKAGIDAARAERGRRDAEREAALQALESCRQALEAAVAGRAHIEKRREAAVARVERFLAQLAVDDGFAAVARERLAAPDGAARAWLEETRRAVDDHRAAAGERERCRARGEELERELSRVGGALDARRPALAALEAEEAAHGAEVEALATRRSAMLDGAAVEVVVARLEEGLESAERAAEDASTAHDAASRAAAEAGMARQAAAIAVGENRTRLARARATLDEGLGALGIDRAELDRRLARAGWADRARAELAALDREQATAETLLAERKRKLEQHRSRDVPPETEIEVTAAQAEAVERLAALDQELGALEGRRVLDDQARRTLADLDGRLAAHRRDTEVWQALDELIGSSDGKKLRVFAQSLTLDGLLAHANHHLAELARRYRLERVPGQDLDLLVVDRDMGDERRSVLSLSGGESFLVSLALALALSTLASDGAQLASLFIDEGFGTLDGDTLEVALAALDALQASGRQVGLVSHVAGLAERVGVEVRVVPRGQGSSELRVSWDTR